MPIIIGNCVNCGKPIIKGSGYIPKAKSKVGRFFQVMNAIQPVSYGNGVTSEEVPHFCCERCYLEYCEMAESQANASQQAKIQKKQAKVAEKERKEAKKEAKKQKALENSKITSDESLAKTFKLCLVGGYIGVHDFALGKLKTGIIKDIIAFYAIFGAISNKAPGMLAILLVNIAWWGIDLIRIKSGKFTDKYGYSIRN